MSSITITIKTDNAAFGYDTPGSRFETARILRELGHKIINGDNPERINDGNGHGVCTITYDDEPHPQETPQ